MLVAGISLLPPPAPANAASDFKAPWTCGATWHASTYAGHVANAVDFNDFPDEVGQPVLASAAGTVTTQDPSAPYSYGNMVKINHGGGWETRYAHLASFAAMTDRDTSQAGLQVNQGDVVGYVGMTEASSNHLHYEQRLNGTGRTITFDGVAIAVATTNSPSASDPAHESTNCGSDTDGDGTPNTTDACPTQPGPASNNGCPLPAMAKPAVAGDFTGDGKDDVAWHSGSQLHLLVANGTAFSYGGVNPTSAPINTPDWAGAGNVDGTGADEVYWYHSSNQTLYAFYWTGTTWNVKGSIGGIQMPDSAVAGDFTGDGKDDVAWHSGSLLHLLVANGGGFSYGGVNPASAPISTPDWAGAGNVDGTGADEVYWYQSSNQTLYTFYWTGTTWNVKGSTSGIQMHDSVAVGDFTGDSKDDVAWHSGSSLHLLAANGTAFSYGGVNPPNAPINTADWAGAGNVDGTGVIEVYWYQSSNQTLYTFYWTGTTWNVKGSTPGIQMPN